MTTHWVEIYFGATVTSMGLPELPRKGELIRHPRYGSWRVVDVVHEVPETVTVLCSQEGVQE